MNFGNPKFWDMPCETYEYIHIYIYIHPQEVQVDRKLPETPWVWGISGILDHPKPTSHELVGIKKQDMSFVQGIYLGGGLKYFYFHSYLGKISHSTNIFQMG